MTGATDLAKDARPRIAQGRFDPDLLAVESACSRDYSAAWCAIGA